MNNEQRNQIDSIFNIRYEDDGCQMCVKIADSDDSKVSVTVRKVTDGQYSFGYYATFFAATRELECGVNVFKGNLRTLVLGFMKSLLRIDVVRRSQFSMYYVKGVIDYIESTGEPVMDDRNIRLEAWQPPIKFSENFLR